MKTINLPYGKGKLAIEIPEERLAGILLSKAHDYQAKMGEEDLVRDALMHPVGTPRLKELARGKDNIVMIASDHTRPVPSKVIHAGCFGGDQAGKS